MNVESSDTYGRIDYGVLVAVPLSPWSRASSSMWRFSVITCGAWFRGQSKVEK